MRGGRRDGGGGAAGEAAGGHPARRAAVGGPGLGEADGALPPAGNASVPGAVSGGARGGRDGVPGFQIERGFAW